MYVMKYLLIHKKQEVKGPLYSFFKAKHLLYHIKYNANEFHENIIIIYLINTLVTFPHTHKKVLDILIKMLKLDFILIKYLGNLSILFQSQESYII